MSRSSQWPGGDYIPLWTIIADDDGNYAAYGKALDGETKRLRQDDGIHFTPAGYDIIAVKIRTEIDGLLAKSSPTGSTEEASPPPAAAPSAPMPAAAPAENGDRPGQPGSRSRRQLGAFVRADTQPARNGPGSLRGPDRPDRLRAIERRRGYRPRRPGPASFRQYPARILPCAARGAERPASGSTRWVIRRAGFCLYWRRWRRSRPGKAAAPIDIIQIGDSHTANGAFAGRMRELFQQRFGAAGRGMLQPGLPFDYYHPLLATVSENARWTLSSSFPPDRRRTLGPGRHTRTWQPARRRMVLTSTEDQGFSHAAIEVLRRPGAGSVDVRLDDGPVRTIATDGPEQAADWIDLPAAPGQPRAERLAPWRTGRSTCCPGIRSGPGPACSTRISARSAPRSTSWGVGTNRSSRPNSPIATRGG